MKTENLGPLKNWVDRHSKEELAFKTGIGFHTVGRILRGEKAPSKTELIALTSVTGLDESNLPFTANKEKAS